MGTRVSWMTPLILLYTAVSFPSSIDALEKTKGFYFTGFAGPNWVYSGKTSLVDFGNLVVNRYVASTGSAVGPIAGAGMGYRWFTSTNNWVSLGVESSYTNMLSREGVVNPLFTINQNNETLQFNYLVESVPLFALFQFGFRVKEVYPYLVGGVGVSWNQANNYNEVPTNPAGGAQPARAMFQRKTLTEFAYTAGAGFQLAVLPYSTFSIEYRYTDYGKAKFAPTATQTTTEGLALGKVSSHAILFRFTLWNTGLSTKTDTSSSFSSPSANTHPVYSDSFSGLLLHTQK